MQAFCFHRHPICIARPECQGAAARPDRKWKTPDKTVIEFYLQGETITGKQISTEHNKKNNNKVVARDLRQTTTNVFEGTVIDPKNGREYKGHFIIDEVEAELELKVTWGLITFNEIWERFE